MSWQTDTTSLRVLRSSGRWRRIGAALLIGLALVVAACGTTTGGGGGGQPTSTPKPSPTATPVPCSTWRIIPSPDGTKYPDNTLSAVSALSTTDAWAVGGNFAQGGTVGPVVSLIERWDGTSWQVVANPGPDFLSGVAAVSATDVWAVGDQWIMTDPSTAGYKTLTLHWNGTQWSIVPSANPSSSGNILNSVVAIAANDVWAVGNYSASGAQLPLVERWDGTAWQVVTTPALPGVTESNLSNAARIPGTQQLWAVGYTLKGPRPAYEQPLVERWDGAAWQVIKGPALPNGSLGGKLNGVAALSATDAWAVGEYYGSDHITRILNAHWDGTSWQVASSPDAWGSLASVAAAGARDVRAVGHIAIGDGANQHPLIERWDGTTWQTATVPALPSGTISGSLSIATDGAGNYWVVGSSMSATGNYHTLTLHCP